MNNIIKPEFEAFIKDLMKVCKKHDLAIISNPFGAFMIGKKDAITTSFMSHDFIHVNEFPDFISGDHSYGQRFEIKIPSKKTTKK